MGFLKRLLFGFIPVHVSVKILHFYQVLEQNNAKQKSYAKSFKDALSLAYDRMPTKTELTNLGRIAYLINDLKSVSRITRGRGATIFCCGLNKQSKHLPYYLKMFRN